MNSRSCHRELRWAVLLLSIAVGLAFAPDDYLPMLARAFLLQWAAAFMLVAILLVRRKFRWSAMAALFGGLLIAAQIPPPYIERIERGDGPALRILHMNVLQPNTEFSKVIGQAIMSEADVISVQEVGPDWADALRSGLHRSHPYAHVVPRTNCYGIALFSKHPFTMARTIVVAGSPFIEVVFQYDGTPIRLLAVHATSPTSYADFKERNRQLELLADHLAVGGMATVLIGDLNTVPWDRAFRRLCQRSDLFPTTASDQLTWPAMGPLALIPLDHLLVSEGLAPASIRTFGVAGSDHRGILADLYVTSDAR